MSNLPASSFIDSAAGELDPRGDLRWFDLKLLSSWEGRGWPSAEMEKLGDRLPARAHGVVPEEVWKKSHYASGLCVRFHSDTDRVFLRWTDRSGQPPTAKPTHSCPDLYVEDADSRWRWAGLSTNMLEHNRAWITDDFPAAPRNYLLYLGYLDGLSSISVGLAPSATLAPLPLRSAKPIVFYGTSITCGQYASRAGRVFSAVLGRKLDRPVINLGFPGNGKMELPTTQFIAEIDAAVYVVACLENMDSALIAERTGPLVECLRKARPSTPIVLVESIVYEGAWLIRAHAKRVRNSNTALRTEYEKLQKAGVQHLHYMPTENLFPPGIECTVDGSHPNDIGFECLAKSFERTLREIIA
jgi:hypothetical protein